MTKTWDDPRTSTPATEPIRWVAYDREGNRLGIVEAQSAYRARELAETAFGKARGHVDVKPEQGVLTG